MFSQPPFPTQRVARSRGRDLTRWPHADRPPAAPSAAMYLNLVQLAESFGVSEKVVEDWIRREGLPHVPERGRLLFDRAQVADWAATRGLAAHAGFLAPADSALATTLRLEPLLRHGGIWRGVPAADFAATCGRVIENLPAVAPTVRHLVAQKVTAPGGINLAPVGGGIALPHPSARIALGRESGTIALLFLREPIVPPDSLPDGDPVTRLFFFVAPSPRAHLDLLGRLSRLLSRGPVRELLARPASDDEIFAAVASADGGPAPSTREDAR